jgi:hypothetical protein
MHVINTIIIYTLLALAYLVTPTVLVLGWVRWSKRNDPRTPSSTLSFVAFILASSSAALGFATLLYAQAHPFGFYDPVLLRIYRCGALLSCTAALSAFAGVWRSHALRWYAPASAIGTLAFWLMAAASE